MPQPKIVRQSQQAEVTPGGTVRQLIRIDFTIGEDGPFNLTIPVDEYNAEVVYQRVNAFAQQTAALRVKTDVPAS